MSGSIEYPAEWVEFLLSCIKEYYNKSVLSLCSSLARGFFKNEKLVVHKNASKRVSKTARVTPRTLVCEQLLNLGNM